MSTATVKQNDIGWELTANLTNNGVVIDLTGANVQLVLKRKDFPAASRKSTTVIIVSIPTAAVKYKLSQADLQYDGTFSVEWEITKANGDRITVPNSGYDTLIIEPDLG